MAWKSLSKKGKFEQQRPDRSERVSHEPVGGRASQAEEQQSCLACLRTSPEAGCGENRVSESKRR